MLDLLMLAGAAALLIACWPQIVEWCTTSLAPWIERECGLAAGNGFRVLINWMDGLMALTTQALQKAWVFLGEKVLRLNHQYKRVGAGRVLRVSESVIAVEGDRAMRRIEEEELPWERVPSEVRSCMIKSSGRSVGVDVQGLLQDRVRTRASEESMALEMRC